MSGGVDSSVAALLLQKQGYRCFGVTMRLLDNELLAGTQTTQNGCCSIESVNDARRVCEKLNIPFKVLNLSYRFYDEVVHNFIDEYLAGRTPNPCVLCNRKIKWEALIGITREMGADFIATGHYARIAFNEQTRRYELKKAKDLRKDQSYALWAIEQKNLARTLFPLGYLTKPEVREIARNHGLITAHKSESMDICFIPDNNYKRFLYKMVKGLNEKLTHGELVDSEGNLLGEQPGYPFFTIGQRRGIGKGFGKPMYVIGTDPVKNRVIIGEKEKLFSAGLEARDINFVSLDGQVAEFRALTKIRYNDAGKMATVYLQETGRVRVVFDEPQKAITPGQSVVFYEGECILAGGIIDKVIHTIKQ